MASAPSRNCLIPSASTSKLALLRDLKFKRDGSARVGVGWRPLAGRRVYDMAGVMTEWAPGQPRDERASDGETDGGERIGEVACGA